MSTDTEFENKACARYEALLEDYLDGALDRADAATAERHWRECVNCREALEQASASVQLLRLASDFANQRRHVEPGLLQCITGISPCEG